MKQIIKESEAVITLPNNRKPGIRGYKTYADRDRAIRLLTRKGFNYFVCFKDVQAEFALSYGWAAWVGNFVYVNR